MQAFQELSDRLCSLRDGVLQTLNRETEERLSKTQETLKRAFELKSELQLFTLDIQMNRSNCHLLAEFPQQTARVRQAIDRYRQIETAALEVE